MRQGRAFEMKTKTMQDYLIRGIPIEIWKLARIRAIRENLTMPVVMRELVTLWATGKVNLILKEKR